ncbi:serine hydrolase domain-containing protein [Mucilaginibacter arboris]|uniref:Serine hydrolase n=1 Tax=Mucilaginibacter arboris TaxID=2682090 RepID=A0A7K1SWP9_9SPHI|nr:serine hydrolase [Mucilaginibacter arboris]MVN21668.1 serine hydrolase [Mucilaginibacter arboris]
MYIKSVNRSCIAALLWLVVILNSACAQVPGPHQQNQGFLAAKRSIESSTVLLNNQDQLVPVKNLDQQKIASVRFGFENASVFDSLLNKYTKIQSFNASAYAGSRTLDGLLFDLKFYTTVIVQLNKQDLENPALLPFLSMLDQHKNLIVACFGALQLRPEFDLLKGVLLWSPVNSAVAANYAAQMIFGGAAATQKLSASISPKYRNGDGSATTQTRLAYSVPEEAGINADNLNPAIDKIVAEAINQRATPGAVVLVARNGKVIFNKAYGSHTYNDTLKDKITDIFDLASVTKVSATTMDVMRLYDQGKLNLDSTAGSYLASARNTNKNDIKIREFLTHQSGMVPDIITWEKLKAVDRSTDSSAAFPTKVADHFYLKKDYFKDVIWPDMLKSPLKTRGKYVYSDLSMYFMKEIVETISSTPLNVYVQQNFYSPLGMQTAGFLPLNRFPKDQIVPTENDSGFRHQLLIGYVHDQGAGLLGGVSGHAGLFASANDLAILYQMILNRGTYGGVQYLKPETVDLFTSKQSDVSRRGLGFDRWDPNRATRYPSVLASDQTYGHTGYTGTCFWVDPKYNLVYIFLSNRVNPKVTDKLSDLGIRRRIQDAVYEAIEKGI